MVPGLRSRGLDAVATYFGVDIADRHRAGGDAMATARILERLLALAEEQGATTLADLEALMGRRRRPRRRRSAMPKPMEEG